MSTKYDIKIEAVHEIGVRLDDALESAKVEVTRNEGAQGAYLHAAKSVQALQAHLARDVEEGRADPVAAKLAADWIMRATQVCENLSKQAGNAVLMSRGAELQTARLVSLVKNLHELEVARRDRETAPAEAAAPEERPHPRPRSIKEERIAEVRTKKGKGRRVSDA